MKSYRTIPRSMNRFGSSQLVCLLVVVILLMIGANAYAVSFSADLVISEEGKTKTSKFFLLDDLYRLDVVEDGQELVILVNRTSGKTRVLNPSEKQYREMKNDSFQSVMNNPIEAYYRIRKDYETRMAGSETISGIECDKVILSDAGKDLMTAWVAKPYGLPIQIVNPNTGDKFELKNIKEGRIDKAKFQMPAGYTEQEDPAEKRAREEAALPFLTTTATGTAPLVRRIGPRGEMRVVVDPKKSVRIKFENFTQDESVFSIKGFRSGGPIDLDCQYTSFSLKGKGRRDDCMVGPQNNAEEISVVVEKGKIIAEVFNEESSFSHEDKTEAFFIATGIQDSGRSAKVDSKRQLRLSIASDSQDSPESTIKVAFYKDQGKKDKTEETDLVLKNGQSKTWDYPAENGIQVVDIDVAKGGGVQVIIEQPAPVEKAAVKKTAQPKVTDVFTVTHPKGTGKPVSPDKNLGIIVTGLSADASGVIRLFTDRNQTKKIDTFSFRLEKGQKESLFVPGYKQTGWAIVQVHRGSFTVKLDQSENARAEVDKARNKAETAAPASVKPPAAAASSGAASASAKPAGATPAASGDTILNGEVPLMQGTTVLKETIMGASGRYDLEVPATPGDIITFYKNAMTAKGWQAGMAMTQGPMGVLQLTKGKSQIMIKAKGSGQKSIVNLALVSQ